MKTSYLMRLTLTLMLTITASLAVVFFNNSVLRDTIQKQARILTEVRKHLDETQGIASKAISELGEPLTVQDFIKFAANDPGVLCVDDTQSLVLDLDIASGNVVMDLLACDGSRVEYNLPYEALAGLIVERVESAGGVVNPPVNPSPVEKQLSTECTKL